MCGICGIFHYRDRERPVDGKLLQAMTTAIRHRGPDDEGYYEGRAVGLGMRRLSIIDLEGGAQPIFNESGSLVTVFNGEIYNFQELRQRLEQSGHRFATASDTETIPHGYEQWGLDFLEELNGMYGLALWDEEHRTLVLARDPYGIKPLYYYDDGKTLRFGSEIRSILCDPEVPRAVDEDALDLFLAFTYVPSPATAFAGIRKVPPGHALVCTEHGIRMQRFHVTHPQLLVHPNQDEIVDTLRVLIARAVERQMVADVPVGALLSGGVDSTTTATIMNSLAAEPIDTFTVGFGDDRLDELEQARRTATRLGTRHHEIVIPAHQFQEFLPLSVWHLEEPVATDSTLAYYKVCELARQHVKVVLAGQGADEPFAGYQRHLGERYGSFYRALPPVIRDRVIAGAVAALPRNERLKRAVRSLGTRDAGERSVAVWRVLDTETTAALLGAKRDTGTHLAAMGGLWADEVGQLDGLSRMLFLDARLSLSDNLLMYGDKMAMAVSLEARVPFLDLELMRFVETIPPNLKVRRGSRKYILKQAVAAWVPAETLKRRKIAFTPPIDRWLRGDLSSYLAENVLSEGSACRGLFDRRTLEGMVNAHVDGREDYKRGLLSLLIFELWHRQFIKPSRVALLRALSTPSTSGSIRS